MHAKLYQGRLMHKWLPYASWEVESPLRVDDLVNGMSTAVERSKCLRWRKTDHLPFEGEIGPDGFHIRRVIHYQNSFLPQVYGRFDSCANGSVIRVRMMIHPLILAFMTCWFVFLGLWSTIAAIQEGMLCFVLPAALLGGFLILLAYVGFFMEAAKTKGLLEEVFARLHEEDSTNISSKVC
jgi:hypothetical protein